MNPGDKIWIDTRDLPSSHEIFHPEQLQTLPGEIISNLGADRYWVEVTHTTRVEIDARRVRKLHN